MLTRMDGGGEVGIVDSYLLRCLDRWFFFGVTLSQESMGG